ncbi:MAG: hypothetical protein V5A13_04900 [Haloarculaceae archaeon]
MSTIAGCSFSTGDESTGQKVEISAAYGDGEEAFESGRDAYRSANSELDAENYQTAAEGYGQAGSDFDEVAGHFSEAIELFEELEDTDGRDICVDARDGTQLYGSSAGSLRAAMEAAEAGDTDEARTHFEEAESELEQAQAIEVQSQSQLRTTLGLGDDQQGP